ncbi:MAG TPA: aspartate kinase [Dehalococcoidia bacterium]|nr:aspartate kinase [Dehalococcoidia bacterium]
MSPAARKPPRVQKYGGTSVGSPARLRKVARRIAQCVDDGDECIVVVSAMGKTTDDLVALAQEITPSPSGREYDMLLATGEIVSSALLALALRELGHPAIALTGAQAGVNTDDTFNRARITSVDTARIRQELKRDHVVIIAGFQGMSSDSDFTTLGRGGSDTSAVALAAAIDAERAEIYTDVDGVFTTDPRIERNARKLHDIAYEEMLELAAQGAGIMHPRAVELGLLHDVPILVASSFNDDVPGTLIRRQVEMEPTNRVRGVALDADVAAITVRAVPDRPGIAAQIFGPLADDGVSVDTIVQNASVERLTDLTFTVAHDDWRKAKEITDSVATSLDAGEVIVNHDLAKVSIVGTGMQSGVGYAATMFRALAAAEINVQEITTSEIRITVLVAAESGESAVRVLHEAFQLDEPANLPT